MSAALEENKESIKNGCSSSKSSESTHSASSLGSRVRMLHRKSQYRQAGFISTGLTNGPDVRQRVLSARLHRYKTMQNQLNEVLQQNATLCNENRLLKTLHKRQDTALAKYENSQAELPQLINSHTEEIRVWQTKYKTLNVQQRELNKQIIKKDKTINELNDRIRHLTRLNDDKNLEERELLTVKLQLLERQLTEKDEELKMLTRRNHLEAKNFKVQLSNEKKKYKELCQKFEQASAKRYGSSNESDRSSAKDLKEIKYALLSTTNNSPMPKLLNLNRQSNNESQMSNAKGNLSIYLNGSEKKVKQNNVSHDDDDDDDDDLIIRTILNDKKNKIESDELQQIAQSFLEMNLLVDETMPNIQEIQNQIRNDIEANEKLLDQHCDEVGRDINILARSESLPKTNEKEATNENSVSYLPKFKSHIYNKPIKRQPIDPQNKNKLLAALKSIDSSGGRV